MGKDLNITVLLDFYGELLTENQSKVLDLYYNEDLSLAEIAEPMGITRQGVRDSIKRGEKQLYDLEEKLGLANRFKYLKREISSINKMFSEVKEYVDTYIHSDKLSKATEKISQRLSDIGEKL